MCGQCYEVKVIIGVLAGIVRFLLQYQENKSVVVDKKEMSDNKKK